MRLKGLMNSQKLYKYVKNSQQINEIEGTISSLAKFTCGEFQISHSLKSLPYFSLPNKYHVKRIVFVYETVLNLLGICIFIGPVSFIICEGEFCF